MQAFRAGTDQCLILCLKPVPGFIPTGRLELLGTSTFRQFLHSRRTNPGAIDFWRHTGQSTRKELQVSVTVYSTSIIREIFGIAG